ncbi:MAG: sulfatase-like hydrolase/transferase [Rhodospirillales bacterium]
MARSRPAAKIGNRYLWPVVPALVVVAINLYFAVTFQIMKHVVVDPRFSIGPVFVPAQVFDFLAVYYLALVLVVLQKRPLVACLVASLLAATATTAAWVKFLFLAQGPRFSDLFLLDDVSRGLPLSLSVLVVSIVAFAVAVMLWNFRLRAGAFAALALAPAAVVGALLVLRSMSGSGAIERLRDNPYQPSAYYGFYLQFAFSGYERLEAWLYPEEPAAADSGGRFPDFIGARVPRLDRGNLHVIVVESLIDATRLGGYRFSRDPFPAWFRRAATESPSAAVAPIFGGFSADAEFEILCGLPLGLGGTRIVFNNLAPDRIDCLPNKLAAKGWTTQATIATTPHIFSLGRAYPKIGFQRLISAKDLDAGDLDGRQVSAESMLEQVFRRVEKLEATGRPYLNYVVIMAGHFPYVRDRSKRPDVIDVAPADDIVKAYVNAAYYNAAAVERYVGRVSALDPDATFVIVGDHGPILGPDFHGYRRGGVVGAAEADPARTNLGVYEVTLVIARGKALVPVGRVAQFEIPYLVLDALSSGRFCRQNPCPAGNRLIRPIQNRVLVAEGRDGPARVCGPGPAASAGDGCGDVDAWRTFYRARLLGLME